MIESRDGVVLFCFVGNFVLNAKSSSFFSFCFFLFFSFLKYFSFFVVVGTSAFAFVSQNLDIIYSLMN